MAKPLVSDELWAEVEPILPPTPPRPRSGRPRIPDRAVLTDIVFVLRTGTPWELLPPEMGCVSGMTCWRRLRDWHAVGVWEVLHWVLLQKLADADKLDWRRACLDSCSVPAQKGGEQTGANPVDRGRPGTKRHAEVERGGLPLAAVLSAANVHDSRMLEKAVDAVPAIAGPRGRPRCRPKKLHADKGYDCTRCRAALRARGLIACIARRGQNSSQTLGCHRWVVKRTLA